MAANEMEVVVDLRGLQRFIAQARPTLEKVVLIAAHNVEGRAKELVPVDTGATKNSIIPTPIDDGLGASIGPSTTYAPWLEFGTHRMAARPFMRPALEAENQPFQSAIIAALQQVAGGS